jgi:hypothetical protein
MPGTKGYEGTATGIDESIKKLNLGKCWTPYSYTCLLCRRLVNGHPIQEQCFPLLHRIGASRHLLFVLA